MGLNTGLVDLVLFPFYDSRESRDLRNLLAADGSDLLARTAREVIGKGVVLLYCSEAALLMVVCLHFQLLLFLDIAYLLQGALTAI